MTSTHLAETFAAESGRIRKEFEAHGDGRVAAHARSDLLDRLAGELFGKLVGAAEAPRSGLSLDALGGYGRRELFPHSDVDLLLLGESRQALDDCRDAFAALVRTLWDVGLRVGSTARTLAECGELDRTNLEFSISLLDSRHLAGDGELSARLHDRVIPHLVGRDRADLASDLIEMTARRHEKFGNTIFHLEPNIKEAPGGLRDYHVARWLALIAEMGEQGRWASPEELWPAAAEAREAARALADIRTFVHYARGRDDNQLSYEIQEQAAARGVGARRSGFLPAEWMRSYFRRARAIDRLVRRQLNEAAPRRASLFGLYQDWKSRLSTPDFSVVRGEIYPRQPEADGLSPLLGAFELVARHGLELSREAERWVEQAIAKIDDHGPIAPRLWDDFRAILIAPEAARALRAMHRLGLLDHLFPEFRAVDALVIRDFYHRYTVDEHSLMTIENLGRLGAVRRVSSAHAAGTTGWEPQFAELASELEQPELLFLSLLFHDVGKGIAAADHVQASLAAVENILTRLAVSPQDRATVRFLISNHLEMSRTLQRRDIFAPETARELAEKVGTPERLKMLALLTYADIQSVNPEALTPWKAEMLWQLYTVTSNYLARSLDRERFSPGGARPEEAEVLASYSGDARRHLAAFLEGFPRRYVRSHSPEAIAAHFWLAQRLPEEPTQLDLVNRGRLFELTVVTRDRPFLFASITGTLAAWGMNILKADAFANASGTVLDTFRFGDLHRTLELNPSEIERFKNSLRDVLAGRESVEKLMRGRLSPRAARLKVRIPTQVRFEEPPSLEGPARTTLVELITEDRPGLLYQVSSVIAELGFNIEVALIDTEGEKVIDVFYLTQQGHPLSAGPQQALRAALLEKLRPRKPA